MKLLQLYKNEISLGVVKAVNNRDGFTSKELLWGKSNLKNKHFKNDINDYIPPIIRKVHVSSTQPPQSP